MNSFEFLKKVWTEIIHKRDMTQLALALLHLSLSLSLVFSLHPYRFCTKMWLASQPHPCVRRNDKKRGKGS